MPASAKPDLRTATWPAWMVIPEVYRMANLACVPLAMPAPQFDAPLPALSQVSTPPTFFQPCADSSDSPLDGLYAYGPCPLFSFMSA